jgi:hypothetical protein
MTVWSKSENHSILPSIILAFLSVLRVSVVKNRG